jgi:signal transduction histidine kinase
MHSDHEKRRTDMAPFKNIKERLVSTHINQPNFDEVEKQMFPLLRRKSDSRIFEKEIKTENIIVKEEVENLKEDVKRKETILKMKLEQLKKEYNSYVAEMEVSMLIKDSKIEELTKQNLILQDKISSLEQTILLQREVNKKLKQNIAEQTEVYMQELKDKMEIIKQQEKEFSKTIARAVHDLKNPLTSVKSTAEALSEYEDLDEEKKILINLIISGAEDLSKMIEDILISTKIAHNAYTVEKKQLNISKLIEEMVEQTRIYVNRTGKEISADIEKDLIVNADELKIKRAIGNLISNGLKYGKRCVKISAKSFKNKVEIEISDDGEGFDREVKEKVFSNKEMSTTDLINGNGFGLTNAKRIIELHGGQISVLSCEKGTTFKIILPNE